MRVKTLGIFARIVGYYSRIANWNEGKKKEWADREVPELKEKKQKKAA